MAQLIELPRPTEVIDEPPRRSAATVDEWGRDAQLIEQLSPLLRLRWNVSVGGLHHLPARAGALLVTNERRLSMSPLYVSWALSRATGRPVRFVGRPDSAPLGPALRRIGALLRHPDEVRGALRHGELVLIGAGATNHPRHAGTVDHQMIGAAVTSGVAVVPVASMSSMFGRSARAEVGAPIRQRRNRRGPLADVEVAEAAQRQIQKMLDEFGGAQTGVAPIDWLGEG
jgi:1-acyl-sn-glycerol-3-phosphate acyltransferase